MNSLQVNLENIHTNSKDLPYGFTTGELYGIASLYQLLHRTPGSADLCVEVFKNSFLAFSMTQALWAFGGAIGSILGGISGVRFGRKNTLLLNNLFIVSGIVLQVSLISINSMF